MKRRLYLLSILILGVAIFVYVLFFSERYAFLADAPQSCATCHQMNNSFESWEMGGKVKGASCNDCHVDNTDLMAAYASKLKDGFHHAQAWLFASAGNHQLVLQDSARVQDNCMRCHASQLEEERFARIHAKHFSTESQFVCWRCHDNAGHKQVETEVRNVTIDTLPKPVWLRKLESQELL